MTLEHKFDYLGSGLIKGPDDWHTDFKWIYVPRVSFIRNILQLTLPMMQM